MFLGYSLEAINYMLPTYLGKVWFTTSHMLEMGLISYMIDEIHIALRKMYWVTFTTIKCKTLEFNINIRFLSTFSL